MNISHIEHLGIAVKSLDEAIPFWEKQLGLKCYAIEEVKEQKVRTAFFKVGQSKIELLESTDPEGPIGGLVLHGRVPPPVEMDDMVRGGEVEPGATCFQ